MTTRTNAGTVPRPIEVGPEMAALERFFCKCTWEGTIHEGGMGPGTPAMKGHPARHGPTHPGRTMDRR